MTSVYSKLTTIVLLSLLHSSIASAQGSNLSSDSLSRDLAANFAVPESPAFTILGTTPSNVLRPATVRSLALGFSDFIGPGTSVAIPKSFATEFSPALLIGGKNLSLADYQKAPALFRFRLSAATTRANDQSSASSVAVGARASIIDGADLRTNSAQIARLTGLSEEIRDIQTAAALRAGRPGQRGDTIYTREELQSIDAITREIKQVVEAEQWNAPVLDLALALRLQASDSLGNDLRADHISAWLSGGLGVGKSAQFLLNAQGGTERDTLTGDFKAQGSVALRGYVGTNRYKFLAEGQGEFFEDAPSRWLINLGGEAVLIGAAWLSFTGGFRYDRDRNKWDLVSNFALQFALPEL